MLNFTTLCYLEQGDKYLMLFRNKREADINQGKWLGVGGHSLENESKEACLLREVYEETGLRLKTYELRATLHFIMDEEEELCYLFTSKEFEGTMSLCDEGELAWVPKEEILKLPLWEGDYLFLNRLLKDAPYFEMTLYYENGRLKNSLVEE